MALVDDFLLVFKIAVVLLPLVFTSDGLNNVMVMVMGWEEPFVASFLAVPMQPKQ